MPTPIKIIIDDVTLSGELFDSPCAEGIARLLPLDVAPHVWGDEFYFEIPLKTGADKTATSDIEVGDIGYWPPGHALAIFFGPTPMSSGAKPVPASDVNLVGRVTDDVSPLKRLKGAVRIRIEAAKVV